MEPGSMQMMDQPMCNCPMASAGPVGMIFAAMFLGAVIAALIALTVFLFRRSRPVSTGK